MKASAIAHSNIAFIKYWGRSADHPPLYNIPLNDTVSMTKLGLEDDVQLKTHTTIAFSGDHKTDMAYVNGDVLTGRGMERVVTIIDMLRESSGCELKFLMKSHNDFPTQAGMASSASGFAALARAAASALDLEMSAEELSKIVRIGSGSAARSLHSGFVYFNRGTSHASSFAEQICNDGVFDVRAVIAVIDAEKKKVTSDDGHASALTSPFNEARVTTSQQQAAMIRDAILDKDFSSLGHIAEENCKYMHAVMMTSKPPLFYWQPNTLRVIKSVMRFREDGLECYFTIDAGPNVHCLCRPQDVEELNRLIKSLDGVKRTIQAKPGPGAYESGQHLF
jgi:diphosphomevalonate decarboxylase